MTAGSNAVTGDDTQQWNASLIGQVFRVQNDLTKYRVAAVICLTISAIGTELRGYIGGVLMFVVEDGDITAGQIAVYTWDEPTARFSHVRVYSASQAYDTWLTD